MRCLRSFSINQAPIEGENRHREGGPAKYTPLLHRGPPHFSSGGHIFKSFPCGHRGYNGSLLSFPPFSAAGKHPESLCDHIES